MNVASRKSKTTPSERDPADVDGSCGYLRADEINNVWQFRMRQLDAEIWPRDGRMPSRNEIIDFFANIKIELLQRADRQKPKASVSSQRPIPKPQEPTTPAESNEDRRSRLSKFY